MLATFDGHGKKTKVIKVLLWLVSPGTMKMGGDVVAALGKVFPIESGGGMALLQSLNMVQTKLKAHVTPPVHRPQAGSLDLPALCRPLCPCHSASTALLANRRCSHNLPALI